ncbi:hypothetical protein N7474_009656 [Penicillium riverlandense]|uniref:uncharacterized protein n=1 Tax=Penicillium riverlandense TaxID=1903569 RepID=UPI0025476B5D|nr:uncharacterized protein N7474_009656 [Penicillium riverlandense]KAJ5808387.1 hypothetical protein N7474_009656 [Penicillium riverlandense]
MGSHNIVITPDRETSDLFFRFIQDNRKLAGDCVFHEVRRLSPQMWTWHGNPEDWALWNATYHINKGTAEGKNQEHLKKLRGKVFLRHYGKADHVQLSFPPIPHIDHIKDHISGDVFFIRNKLSPERYWVKDGTTGEGPGVGNVITWTTARSKFRIQLAMGHQVGRLMVEDDDVKMSLVLDGQDYPLQLKDAKPKGALDTSGGKDLVCKFGDLLNGGFSADNYGEYLTIFHFPDKLNNGLSGELWELV